MAIACTRWARKVTCSCLRVADGTVVWSRNLPKDYGFDTSMWGCAGHPLVDGQKLICVAGGEGSVVVALDKLTGKNSGEPCRRRNRVTAHR